MIIISELNYLCLTLVKMIYLLQCVCSPCAHLICTWCIWQHKLEDRLQHAAWAWRAKIRLNLDFFFFSIYFLMVRMKMCFICWISIGWTLCHNAIGVPALWSAVVYHRLDYSWCCWATFLFSLDVHLCVSLMIRGRGGTVSLEANKPAWLLA